jgi:hypothetical protein
MPFLIRINIYLNSFKTPVSVKGGDVPQNGGGRVA